MDERPPLYEGLIFVCTNNRGTAEGVRESCGVKGSEELRIALKAATKQCDAQERVRVHSSGCMEGCEIGPNILCFPEGVMYSGVTKDDLATIIDRHIRPRGGAVETLGDGPEMK